ncbi:unnamed protein product, partial [marine sediment metagenome]
DISWRIKDIYVNYQPCVRIGPLREDLDWRLEGNQYKD